MEKKKKASFTKEYRAEVVDLVRQRDGQVGPVARQLGLRDTTVYNWVRQAKVDAGQGKPGQLTSAERAELSQLRREVKNLRMEREFLKKTAAWFARQSK